MAHQEPPGTLDEFSLMAKSQELGKLWTVHIPGVGTANGDCWRVNRQLTQRIARDFQWGRPAMEDQILVSAPNFGVSLLFFFGVLRPRGILLPCFVLKASSFS